ncbi:hypothetical protein F5Y06DRAFT_302226 [Hypoxylon sp. FL0890]|nr:hypothetical protein F5Y06DRAFT_302226 [Hypoxylon sp. FL0890]
MDTKVPNSDTGCFWLVEKRAPPGHDGQQLKQELKKDEPFGTKFIGASEEECQTWALEMQYRDKYILQDHIAILDARGARDGTVLMKCYVHPPGLVLGEEGAICFSQVADSLLQQLQHVFAFSASFQDSLSWEVYFGLKEELTDAHGVFDVEKAERICGGEEPGHDIVL